MTIHMYNDEYAGKNGVNGVKELVVLFSIALLAVPLVVIFSMKIIPFSALIAGLVGTVAAIIFIRQRYFKPIMCAQMSAIIEDSDGTYYMMVTPNFRGINIPSTATAALAGGDAVRAENMSNAQAFAIEVAHNEDVIKALFEQFKNGVGKSANTLMYGKPVYIYRLKESVNEYKQEYRIKSEYEGKNKTIKIPNAFPTYFPRGAKKGRLVVLPAILVFVVTAAICYGAVSGIRINQPKENDELNQHVENMQNVVDNVDTENEISKMLEDN